MNEISLRMGSVVEVVDKNENGWWLVQNEEGQTGWAPAGYLEPVHKFQESEEPEPNYKGKVVISLTLVTMT